LPNILKRKLIKALEEVTTHLPNQSQEDDFKVVEMVEVAEILAVQVVEVVERVQEVEEAQLVQKVAEKVVVVQVLEKVQVGELQAVQLVQVVEVQAVLKDQEIAKLLKEEKVITEDVEVISAVATLSKAVNGVQATSVTIKLLPHICPTSSNVSMKPRTLLPLHSVF